MEDPLKVLISLCKNVIKDLKEDESKDALDLYKRFASCDKYRTFARENHIVFNVLIFSKVWSKRALEKYLIEITKGPIETDDQFFEISKAYLTNFEPSLLSKHKIDRSTFIQFYMSQMEDYLKFIKEKALEAEKKKQEEQKEKELQIKKNKELLKKRLGI